MSDEPTTQSLVQAAIFDETAAPVRRRLRRSSLKRQIVAAEKATGKPVTSVTLADGTKLELGESTTPPAVNPWLLDREGKARQ